MNPERATDETQIETHWPRRIESARRVLLLACGALAREILALRDGPLGAFDVTCLPAALRNRPEWISEVIRAKMRGENCRRSEGRRRLPPGASGRIDLERGKRGSG